jgi:hypothetical protein
MTDVAGVREISRCEGYVGHVTQKLLKAGEIALAFGNVNTSKWSRSAIDFEDWYRVGNHAVS